jgi:general secretion pathway protein F
VNADRTIATSSQKGARDASKTGFAPRVRPRDKAQLMVQLADLLDAGCPLSRALDAVTRQAPGKPLGDLARRLHHEIVDGSSLAEAMANLSPCFSETQIAMVRAAEAGGFLQKTLSNLAAYAQQQHTTVRQIRAKLAYPSVLAVTAVASIIFLLSYVVPRFTEMYRTADRLLPTPTRALLAVSGFIAHQWLWLSLGLLALAAVLRFLFRWEPFRRQWDTALLAMPLVGQVVKDWETARFARTIQLLLDGGQSVVASLHLSGRVATNRAFRREITTLADAVEHGEPLSAKMRDSRFFDATAIEMIVISESTGRLSAVMKRLADQRWRDVQLRVDTLLSLVEPAIILVVGALVGLTVVALLLPVLIMNTLIVG